MFYRIVCLIIAGLILSGTTAMSNDTGKEVAAVSAAEKWLATIDAGNYYESWTEAAALFRNAVKPKQ